MNIFIGGGLERKHRSRRSQNRIQPLAPDERQKLERRSHPVHSSLGNGPIF
jgi:hypothetical protein